MIRWDVCQQLQRAYPLPQPKLVLRSTRIQRYAGLSGSVGRAWCGPSARHGLWEPAVVTAPGDPVGEVARPLPIPIRCQNNDRLPEIV